MMEMAFPALRGLAPLGCCTRTGASENEIDSTGTPFRVPTLLSDTIAKTCTSLILVECEMEELPPLIGMYYLLKNLDLSHNKLEEIPPDIGSCYSLTTLDVSNNQLKTIPEEIVQLLHLHTLKFFSNQIVTLPDTIGSVPLLELNGFNNRILKFPETLGKLETVTHMNFAGNTVMQFTKEYLANWRSVRVLNLYECRIVKLASLGHLEQLEELRLFNNNLEEAPDVGTRLSKLKVVELNKNRITALPLKFFQGLKALERIVLTQNQITAIPSGIACPKLWSLIISQNHLTELPPDLPLWPSLRILFLNANSLTKLPETFLQNSTLERVNLARNSKCAAPSKHILEHLKKVTANNKGKYWAPDTL